RIVRRPVGAAPGIPPRGALCYARWGHAGRPRPPDRDRSGPSRMVDAPSNIRAHQREQVPGTPRLADEAPADPGPICSWAKHYMIEILGVKDDRAWQRRGWATFSPIVPRGRWRPRSGDGREVP